MDKPKKPNKKLQHERNLHGWSQARVAEMLGTTVKRVSMWECGDATPDRYYQEKLCEIFHKNTEELGLIGAQDDQEQSSLPIASSAKEATPETADILPDSTPLNPSLPASPARPIQLLVPDGAPVSVTIQVGQQTFAQLPDGSGIFVPVDGQPYAAAYSSYENTSMPAEESEGGIVKRREFFRETGRLAVGLVGTEILDRFYRALKKPSTLDERFLNYLQLHTEGYWRDHYHASLASFDLLGYAREHFQKIVQLLEGPMLPATRTHLCSIAGSTALLIGTLLFDIADYKGSREYFGATIKAAEESDNYTLQATGWGWASLAWTYEGNLPQALNCVRTARQLAPLGDSIIVRTWLAAVDAEAQAKLHNADACRKALDEAEAIKEAEQSELVHYWTSYDKVQFEGYEGSCYQLLYQPEDVRTHAYLSDAQKALREALTETDPVMMRLQSVFLSDLAGTYIQQREIEQACLLAQQALIANAPHSQMIVQRVLTLRQDLEQWKNMENVKNLDAHLMPLLTKAKLN